MEETTKIQIPWSKFDEEEVQYLIAMLFSSLEYHIEHLHKSDRANENGADLIVKDKTEEIAIAVKIKPDQKDRYQLIELSRRQEKRKIYVYIETPTKKFMDSMKEDGKNVEFWDAKKLNDFFLEKNLYFSSIIIFDNHKISVSLDMTKYILFQLWKKSHKLNKKPFKKLDKNSFSLLWRLKDSAVTLNKTTDITGRIFEEQINLKNKELNEHFVKIFTDFLDILESNVSSFLTYFLDFFGKNEQLIYNSIKEQASRSHWFWIASYKPLIDSATMKKELEEAIKNKKFLEESIKKYPNDIKEDKILKKYEEEAAKLNDVWGAIKSTLKMLNLFGEGIEAIIDDIVSEYFNDYDNLDLDQS